MKKYFVVALMAAFAATAAIAAEGPAEIKFEAKMGTVTLDHAGHQAKVSDCTACHHKGVDAGSCNSCHGVDAAAPTSKDAFHKQCKDCHKEKGGPTGCKDCHQK